MSHCGKQEPLSIVVPTSLTLFLLSSCKTDQLLYEPNIAAEQWCNIKPCFEINGVIISEPIGSVLVFILSLLWLLFGIHYLKHTNHQKSKLWFGMALFLGGIAASLAGISHQLFSFYLKCQSAEFCKLTNSL